MTSVDITAEEAAELRDRGTMRRAVDVADLRIVVRHRVDSDTFPGGPRISAHPGAPLAAKLNRHGAVSAVVGTALLGIKPGEFDFVCPLAKGRTYLDGRWRVDVAPGQMLASPDGDRWRQWLVASVQLIRAESGWSWVADAIPCPHAEAP